MAIATTQYRYSANLGTFGRFSDAWIACVRHVMSHGSEVMDGEMKLQEALNVSLSARACEPSDLIAVGAEPNRLDLMTRKYASLSVLPGYNISYGALFRSHRGVDQVRWLAERLAKNRDCKSATIGFHVPGSSEMSCISLVDCKIRDGSLQLNAVFRSQNIYASQPGNACALRKLQDEIAYNLHVPSGALTLHIMSAHIYEEDWGAASDVIANCSAVRPPTQTG